MEKGDGVDVAIKPESESSGRAAQLGLLDDFTGYYLRFAYECVFGNFSTALGSDALKPGSFALMCLITANPGITQVELSRASGRDKSSVTLALRQLEDRGLIKRMRLDSDRRSHACYVTPSGKVVFERISAIALEHLRVVDDIIGADRKPAFIAVLKDLIEALGAKRGG